MNFDIDFLRYRKFLHRKKKPNMQTKNTALPSTKKLHYQPHESKITELQENKIDC